MAKRKSRGQGDSTDGQRSKKLRSGEQEDAEEEEDDDGEAKFIQPIDEAEDHNLNDDEKAWMDEDSDEGDMITQLENLPAWEDDFEDDAETSDDFDARMKKLEDLRSKLKTESRGDIRVKPSADELLRRIRQALKDGDWLPLTAAAATPRNPDIISVVKKLSRQETLDTLQALVARHEHPTEQPNCNMWIHQVLDHEPHDLHGNADVRTVLRPLLTSLRHELGPASQAGQVLGCVVKWRLAFGLAKARKAAPEDEMDEPDHDLGELECEVDGQDHDQEAAAPGDASPDAESESDEE